MTTSVTATDQEANRHRRTRQRILSPAQLYSENVYGGYPSQRFPLGGGVEMERFGQWQAGEIALPPTTHHRIAIHVQQDGNKARSRWRIGGKPFDTVLEPAMIATIPAGADLEASWDDRAHGTILLSVTQSTLVATLDEAEVSSTGVEILPGMHGLDPILLASSTQLLRELKDDRLGNRLMRDALKLQVLVHILRHYTNRADNGSTNHVGRRDRLHAPAVTLALEFMLAHLDEPMGLETLARAARVSRFHLLRLFKQNIGCTPMEELTRLRIARAQDLIRRDGAELSLATVASECGFSDQSHMGRQFKRLVGMTPGAFRRSI